MCVFEWVTQVNSMACVICIVIDYLYANDRVRDVVIFEVKTIPPARYIQVPEDVVIAQAVGAIPFEMDSITSTSTKITILNCVR